MRETPAWLPSTLGSTAAAAGNLFPPPPLLFFCLCPLFLASSSLPPLPLPTLRTLHFALPSAKRRSQ